MTIYEKLGLKNAEFIEIPGTTVFIASHHEYTYLNKNYSLIFITVQGTNSTYEQWTSNLDIGCDSDDFTSKLPDNSLWNNKTNHRGFDIAAGLLKEKITEYMDNKLSFTNEEDIEKILIFASHSRGASIINILGADFEKTTSYKTFTYGFGVSGVTTDKEYASSVKTVFNISNTDDAISIMPLPNWGFVRNGTDIKLSIEESYKEEWEAFTNQTYNNPDFQSQIAEGGLLSTFIPTRKSINKFTDEDKNKLTIDTSLFNGAEATEF